MAEEEEKKEEEKKEKEKKEDTKKAKSAEKDKSVDKDGESEKDEGKETKKEEETERDKKDNSDEGETDKIDDAESDDSESNRNDEDSENKKNEENEEEEEEETGLTEGEVIQLDVEKSSSFDWQKIFLILFIVALLGAIGGGIYYFGIVKKQPQTEKQPSPTTAESALNESPEATEEGSSEATEEAETMEETEEEEAADSVLADYSIEVLNGSGVAGAAGTVGGLLAEEGFSDIDTGNADSYDHTDTKVYLKEDVPASALATIKKQLSDYEVVEGDSLDDSADYDIRIIVGQKS